ncbi:MAG: translation initiation factor IF-2 subunit alpha [Desulfurococcales archaeon]|jgi:translation initiation factor 2 subunit 1|nr:translation initiation factor IF-2 subunit alpha [Desulfurococcales archaeon]
MVLRRKKIPDVGDLVVATVMKIFDYGAYVKLDEYKDLEAYLPWSEITTRHFKDIREVLRENQKIVAKVIRVDRKKSPPAIDISSKRVRPEEQRNKIIEWKRLQKAHNILELLAQKTGKSIEEIYNEVGWKLEDKYMEIMRGLEEIAMRGVEAALEAGIRKDLAEPLFEIVKKHVEIKKVSITGILSLKTASPDGINRIKEILSTIYQTAIEQLKNEGGKVSIYSVGAPRYRIELEGYEYKTLEKALSISLSKGQEKAMKLQVEFSFERK